MADYNAKYSHLPEAVATYNAYDIISGTGITNLYAGNTNNGKLLSNVAFYSDALSGSSGTLAGAGGSPPTTWRKDVDFDFDATINKPTTIGGKVVVNVPISLSGASYLYGYVVPIVRKVSDGVETDLNVSGASSTFSVVTASGFKMLAIDVTIAQTFFKIGDILRLTIEGYCSAENGYSYRMDVGNDPKNRTAGWDKSGDVPSMLTFQLPTRIDI